METTSRVGACEVAMADILREDAEIAERLAEELLAAGDSSGFAREALRARASRRLGAQMLGGAGR
jgi:hypothetical protein